MSISKVRKKLLALQSQHAKLIHDLLKPQPILRGTLSHVYTRCGKANCWCANNPKGHPHFRITWSQHGKMITRKVLPLEIPHIRELTKNYRRFRSLQRRLLRLQTQIKQMLSCHETSLVARTRNGLPSLSLKIKNATQMDETLQKM